MGKQSIEKNTQVIEKLINFILKEDYKSFYDIYLQIFEDIKNNNNNEKYVNYLLLQIK